MKNLLDAHHGCVSSRAVRSALEAKGIKAARDLVVLMRYFDFEAPQPELASPAFRWHAHARSFYSREAYEELNKQQEHTATQAEHQAVAVVEAEEEEPAAPPRERKKARQEEGRLGAYVVAALENIYQSDVAPDESTYVFDVHSDRPGSEYENVDVLAVHWRSQKCVELVTIEVKLEFTARLVQQARNYARFSDRVWIAVPVLADAADAAQALRDYDPMLFEHVVDCGLGILACRKRPGRSYEVQPVHWPQRLEPDPLEKERFLERYRRTLEVARVMAPAGRYLYPSL